MQAIEVATPGNRKEEARKTDLQDNAHSHTSQVAMTASTECEFEILSYLTCSPDMAPSDFYLFPKLKSHLRSTQYGSNEGVIGAVKDNLGVRKRPSILKGYESSNRDWL